MDYWKECVSEALEEAGIEATAEQIMSVADFVRGAHEQYGMAYGHDCIPNPMVGEIEKLRRDLKIEKSKIVCRECGGNGRIITPGPYHYSDSECSKCRGEGKVAS